ncbi:MAG: DNA gyrase inhibitor YacG [Planctomycetes bacterium]|nr:DNA gyrase inhibitor YacG [Planctomycetota bacterium]
MPVIECRHCGKPIQYQSLRDVPTFPFCCERCKLLDLGAWMEGRHAISEALSGLAEPPQSGEAPPKTKGTRKRQP